MNFLNRMSALLCSGTLLTTFAAGVLPVSVLAAETAEYTVAVSQVVGKAGDTVQVSIDLSADDTYATLGFVLNYDPALTLLVDSDGMPESKRCKDAEKISIYTMPNAKDGILGFAAINPKDTTYYEGELVSFYFVIPKDAESGKVYELKLTADDCRKPDGSKFTPKLENGSVKCDPEKVGLRGDANCDGTVDKKDADLILKVYSELSSGQESRLSEQGTKNADVDGDGYVSATDASYVLHYVEKGKFPNDPQDTETTPAPTTAQSVTTTTVPVTTVVTAPSTAAPTTAATAKPTTAAPTTAATAAPTTAAPTTAATAAPTTAAPTTAATAKPTTAAPTTAATAKPTTAAPTTAATAAPTTKPTTAATAAPTTKPTTAAPTTAPVTTAPVSEGLRGDANCDGKVDKADAERILDAYARLAAENPDDGLTDQGRKNADVNGDGRVDSVDASMVLYYINNDPHEFPDESTQTTAAVTVLTTLTAVSGQTTEVTTTTTQLSGIRIQKRDQYGDVVAGALLALTGETFGQKPIEFAAGTIQTDDSSMIVNGVGTRLVWLTGNSIPTFVNLPDGFYYLQEMITPIGYETADRMKFVISGGKLTAVEGTSNFSDNLIIMQDERKVIITTPAPSTAAETTVTTTTKATAAPYTGTTYADTGVTVTQPENMPSTETTTAQLMPERPYTWGYDQWGFANDRKLFGIKDGRKYRYNISDKDLDALYASLSDPEIEQIQKAIEKGSNGSCYGMSATSILAYYGVFQAEALVDGAECLAQITKENINDKTRSAINYYQLLQHTQVISQTVRQTEILPEPQKVQMLISALESGKPVLLGYVYDNIDGVTQSGHAVVAYKAERTEGLIPIGGSETFHYNVRVRIYDNIEPSYDSAKRDMFVNTKDGKWCIQMTNDPNDIKKLAVMPLSSHRNGCISLVLSDLELMNCNGLLSGNQQADIHSNYKYTRACMTMLRPASRLSYSSQKKDSDGTMHSAGDEGMVRFSANFLGDEDPAQLLAYMDSDLGYQFESERAEQMDFSMEYEHCLLSVKSAIAKSVTVNPDADIRVQKASGDYQLSMVADQSSRGTDWHKITVSGKDGGEMRLISVPAEKGFVLRADNFKDVTVFANSRTDSAAITFSADADKVLIYEIDKTTIGIAVDEDGDGKYEKTIATSKDAVKGDVDGDGEVTAADAQLVLIAYTEALGTGEIKMPKAQQVVAEVDGDGKITVADAQLILMYYVNRILSGNPITWEDLLKNE